MRHPRVEVFDDYEAMSRAAAAQIHEALRRKPDLLLCAATGASPTGTYERLADLRNAAPAEFESMRVIKLDEWGGLPMDDFGSCESYLRRHLLEPLGIGDDRYVGFESRPEDGEEECREIREWLDRQGPIDIAVLGLGANGHVALNEPADSLKPFAHVSALDPSSLSHAMLRMSRSRPQYGLTLGLGELLQARRVILLVSGHGKRAVFERWRKAELSTRFPASFLHLHPRLSCLCDREAFEDPG
jgi:galactosamine-6-phosphate isomerase